MSLNKTRKRAIARARRRKEMSEQGFQFAHLGQRVAEAMRSVGMAAQTILDGIADFGRAIREIFEK